MTRRPSLADRWPTLLGLAVTAVLWISGIAHEFSRGLVVAALIYLVWGLFGRWYSDLRWLLVEIAGVVLFGAATLVALQVQAPTADAVLAAGWLAHGAWDVVHHRAGAVVPRWWAEQCAVVDVLLAVILVAGGA
jgi:hypothetical protein